MSTAIPAGQNPSHPPRPAEPEYAPDLIRLRDRLAADGIHIRIPRIGARVDLSDPIEVDGETASEILIRWRHEP